VRRVLFLAYHFPPIGGGGVQRNSKFVRYLRDFGYEPVVVTGPGLPRGRWTPQDATLADDVDGVEVRRIADAEPDAATGWRGRAERVLAMATRWERWFVAGALEAGVSAGRGVELVYASLEPYNASAIAARKLARALRVPLVVDLQDPWALDEMRVYPTGLHRRLELRRMRRALRAADAIVMNTPEAAARVRRRFPELAKRTIVSITNGFDAADFEGTPPERRDGAFRIVHSGYLHTLLGRKVRQGRRRRRVVGGAVEPRVDILTRSHVYLLEAVERLCAARPDLADAVEVHLAGVLSDEDRELAERCPAVRLPGYLPHHETVDLLRTADLLFLPMQDLPAGVRAGLTPGKTYEYLAAARPILAAVPDGDARDLLERSGQAFVCRPSDVEAMTAILEAELEHRRAGTPTRPARAELLARYERLSLSADLADVFDRTLRVDRSARLAAPVAAAL
jgi:glycosyltransferase involved in cell wall biosynthesis